MKGLAEYFLTSFEYLSGFTIPRFNEVVTEDIVTEETVVKSSYFLTYLGIAILGIVGTCVGIGIVEYYIPNTFENVPIVGSTIDYFKDIYYIWMNILEGGQPGNLRPIINSDDNLPTHPNTPEPTPGQELLINNTLLPLSRSSSTDTLTALDNSVLDTPRNTFLNLSRPHVIGRFDHTNFNYNPVNPNVLPREHVLELRYAARFEAMLDMVNNVNNNFEGN